METSKTRKRPIYRVIIYDLRQGAKQKGRCMTLYENGDDPGLDGMLEKIEKAVR